MSVETVGSSNAKTARPASAGWYGLIALAAFVIYVPTFRWLVASWIDDRFYSHGFLVAGLSVWLLLKQIPDFKSAATKPSPWGTPLVALGLVLVAAGTISDIMSLSGLSLVIVVVGVILSCRGAAAFRAVSFPILYFLFAVPVISAASDASGRVLTPMMEFATSATAAFADLIGLHPVRSGTIIRLPGYTMEVVVPCSGMASVVGLMALAALLAYLSDARFWRTVVLILAAVPVALAANIIRLTFTALLGVSFGEHVATGFLHELSGICTFLLGAVLIACIPRGRTSTETPDASNTRSGKREASNGASGNDGRATSLQDRRGRDAVVTESNLTTNKRGDRS